MRHNRLLCRDLTMQMNMRMSPCQFCVQSGVSCGCRLSVPNRVTPWTAEDMEKDPLFQNIRRMQQYHQEMSGGKLPTSDGNGVPLRQRQLPASFWIEPNEPRLSAREKEMFALMTRMAKYQSHALPSGHGLHYKDLYSTGSCPSVCPPPHFLMTSHTERAKLRDAAGCTYIQEVPHQWGLGAAPGHPRPPLLPYSPPESPLPLLYRGQAGIPHTTPCPGAAPTYDVRLRALRSQQLWKPIPTKTLTSFNGASYHPYASGH